MILLVLDAHETQAPPTVILLRVAPTAMLHEVRDLVDEELAKRAGGVSRPEAWEIEPA